MTDATGQTGISVPVTVDDPADIAGVAFTLDYDTTKLSVTGVTSEFFDTFVNLGYTTDDGLTDGKVDGYEKPVVFNPATGGKITKIAAARPTGGTAADGTTLFTLTVDIIDSAAEEGDTFPLTITPTTLSNTTAGYSSSGEEIDLIIGADENYTVLLSKDEATANITAGTITMGTDCIKGDANCDGKINSQDALITLRVGAGKDDASVLKADCDVNNDDKINSQDALIILRYGAGKITSWP